MEMKGWQANLLEKRLKSNNENVLKKEQTPIAPMMIPVEISWKQLKFGCLKKER
jgi:hypothetical protein